MVFFRFLTLCFCILATVPPARADDVTMGIWGGGDDYIVGVMRLALKAESSGHRLVTVINTMPQSRALRDLADGAAPFRVIFSGHSIERETMLRQIDIPIYRGLLGYRMLAVRADRADRFKGIRTLPDLARAVSFGSATTWPDTLVLKHAGLSVVTAPDDTLWTMLDRGRFDAFPRGMNEIMLEVDAINRRPGASPIVIEPTVMIAYPLPLFFYVSKDDEALAQTIERGLKAAYADGSFMAHFNGQPSVRAALDAFAAHDRKVFHLENPNISARVKAIPDAYWHPLGAPAPKR